MIRDAPTVQILVVKRYFEMRLLAVQGREWEKSLSAKTKEFMPDFEEKSTCNSTHEDREDDITHKLKLIINTFSHKNITMLIRKSVVPLKFDTHRVSA